MVDTDEYIRDGTPRWAAIAATAISAYVLTVTDGIATFLSSLLAVPADLLRDLLTWIGETLGLGFLVPADTLEAAWRIATETIPRVGPLTWLLGVLLVFAFWIAVEWMVTRVLEGL